KGYHDCRITTIKWSIPDAEKDVGIKNVGNKGFPDAVNNASGDASGKQSFPTHHEGVYKNTSGKGASRAASGIGFFPTPHETSGKAFNERREFPFSRRVLRDFPTPRHGVGKSSLKSFQFCNLQNRNREGKLRKEKKSSEFLSPFRHCSAAVRRRPPSSLSLVAVCHFRPDPYESRPYEKNGFSLQSFEVNKSSSHLISSPTAYPIDRTQTSKMRGKTIQGHEKLGVAVPICGYSPCSNQAHTLSC
uniref:Uncharacterized protein n=1 Tax=Cucumis melo TaxID=3656 RepID=A0A9I9EL35_CUCME